MEGYSLPKVLEGLEGEIPGTYTTVSGRDNSRMIDTCVVNLADTLVGGGLIP